MVNSRGALVPLAADLCLRGPQARGKGRVMSWADGCRFLPKHADAALLREEVTYPDGSMTKTQPKGRSEGLFELSTMFYWSTG
jgi:hypothetical protein